MRVHRHAASGARAARSRSSSCPGLAERVVPQRPHEDPLLLDDRRRELGGALVKQDDRKNAERLLLKLSIGAAEERLYLSYPRLDVAETRARVPSFYALDVVRAITGEIPDHRQLASDAAAEAGASLAWPAPKDPARAIDDLEHDLASLKPLLDSRDPASVRGHAQYLLQLNDALRRSVISRWARGRSAWSQADGLIRVAPAIKTALDKERLANRPYSLSALQRYSIVSVSVSARDDLSPRAARRAGAAGASRSADARQPLPSRASGVLSRDAAEAGALPVTRDRVAAASPGRRRRRSSASPPSTKSCSRRRSRACGATKSTNCGATLASGSQKMADDRAGYRSTSSSASASERRGTRSERSLKEPVTIDGRFVLRGSVDLIERSPAGDVLRITDHKTGKNRSNRDLIIGGGAVSPARAVQRRRRSRDSESRSLPGDCTTARRRRLRRSHDQIDDYNRNAGAAGADDRRSGNRAGVSRGGAGRTRLHVVRFQTGLRTSRRGARGQQGGRQAGRPRDPEVHAMTATTTQPYPDADARRAIRDDLDDTLVVEAAAGTGKTTELVNRILRVLETGPAPHRTDRRRDVHRKGRRRIEAAPARGARSQTRTDAPRRRSQTRLDEALETLEEAHVNTIHGFCAELIRERPVEARVDPLFAVLTEPQADHLYTRAFQSWLQEALARPSEGLRRALRRTSAPAFGGGDGDGPVDRLRQAGRALAEWREFPHPWQRPPFDRVAAIGRALDLLHRLATLSAAPISERDNLFVDTDAVRRLSRQVELGVVVRPDRSRRLGVASRRSRARSRPVAHTQGQRLQVREGHESKRRAGRTRRALRRTAAIQEGRRRRPGSLSAAGTGRSHRALPAAEGGRGRARLHRSPRERTRSDRVERSRPPPSAGKIHAASSSTSFRIPIRFKRTSCCSSPPTIRASAIPAPSVPFRESSSSSAIRSRRSIVSAAPMSARTGRSARADRGAGGHVLQLTTSYRGVPSIQQFVNAAFSRHMVENAATLQAKYVPLAKDRDDDTVPAVDRRARRAEAVQSPQLRSAQGVGQGHRGVATGSGCGLDRDDSPIPNAGGRWPSAPGSETRVPLEPRHIAILFRRFVSFGEDLTRDRT